MKIGLATNTCLSLIVIFSWRKYVLIFNCSYKPTYILDFKCLNALRTTDDDISLYQLPYSHGVTIKPQCIAGLQQYGEATCDDGSFKIETEFNCGGKLTFIHLDTAGQFCA